MPKTLSVQFGALWVLVLTIWTAEGALERICDASTIRAGPVRGDRCGRNLSTILRDLCNPHGYYSVDPQKRSQSPRHKTTSARLPTGWEKKALLSRREATGFLKGKRSYNQRWNFGSEYQGIVCECCFHKCTMTELMQYCNRPNSALKRSQQGNTAQDSFSSPLAARNILL